MVNYCSLSLYVNMMSLVFRALEGCQQKKYFLENYQKIAFSKSSTDQNALVFNFSNSFNYHLSDWIVLLLLKFQNHFFQFINTPPRCFESYGIFEKELECWFKNQRPLLRNSLHVFYSENDFLQSRFNLKLKYHFQKGRN